MSAYNDFISQIRSWINIQSVQRLPDAMIASWIAMAEERFNTDLRIPEMVYTTTQTFTEVSSPLPDDFLQMEYIRPSKGRPYHYVTSDAYLNASASDPWYCRDDNDFTSVPRRAQYFTIVGNRVFLLPGVDTENGTEVELSYYAALTPLSESGTNAVFVKYSRLYTFAVLALSGPYLDEDERTAIWEGETTARIAALNQQHKTGKLGNGPLRYAKRSFG